MHIPQTVDANGAEAGCFTSRAFIAASLEAHRETSKIDSLLVGLVSKSAYRSAFDGQESTQSLQSPHRHLRGTPQASGMSVSTVTSLSLGP